METKTNFIEPTPNGSCIKSLLEIFLFIDGHMDIERSEEIRHHLEKCGKCYGRVEFEKMVKAYVKTSVGEEKPSQKMIDSVHLLFDQEGL